MSEILDRKVGVWPRFFAFPILSVIGYGLAVNYLEMSHWLVITGWVLVLSYCNFSLAGSFHEAAHGSLFKNRWLNDAWGYLVGFFILIPFAAFQATHRYHHAYMNTPKDYEMWPYCDPTKSRAFRRWFMFLDIFAGIATAPYIYSRISWIQPVPLKRPERRKIALQYLLVFLAWALIIYALSRAIITGTISIQPSYFLLFLPLLFSPMLNTVRKLIEHVGMPSIDPVQGTRTIRGSDWLTNLNTYFLFEISVHGPHHRYPKVRGGELKKTLDKMQQDQRYENSPVFNGYWAAFKHFLKTAWSHPACGYEEWSKPQKT